MLVREYYIRIRTRRGLDRLTLRATFSARAQCGTHDNRSRNRLSRSCAMCIAYNMCYTFILYIFLNHNII